MTTMEFSTKLINMEERLERFAMSLTANREEAKDLLQETYLKALSSQDKFIEFTNFEAWAYTIMKNTFINNYRKAVRQNTIVDTTKDLYYLNNSKESTFIKPDSTMQHKEINKHIDKLQDELKVPFLMHTQGFKYKEIAEKLDLKIGTVKSRIFFTRKKLMESLADYA
ncbi:MAG: sigma-70 family RNA polymerase sigma factor [Bacteroidales bacterium]